MGTTWSPAEINDLAHVPSKCHILFYSGRFLLIPYSVSLLLAMFVQEWSQERAWTIGWRHGFLDWLSKLWVFCKSILPKMCCGYSSLESTFHERTNSLLIMVIILTSGRTQNFFFFKELGKQKNHKTIWRFIVFNDLWMLPLKEKKQMLFPRVTGLSNRFS